MTDPVVPSYINPLPPAPEVTDSVPEFDSKAFPFVEALVDLTGEINATVAGTYQNALAAGEGAVTSTTSAGTAVSAKNDAVIARNAAQAAQAAAEAARDDALTNTKGWSPMLRLENDGDRRVLFVYDWTGGAGTKPSVTGYIGASGLTPNKSLAIDVRGKQGLPGTGGDLMQILGGFDASNQTPITDTDTLLGGIGKAQGQINKANSTLSKAVLSYPDYATAAAAAATLPDGQVVVSDGDEVTAVVSGGVITEEQSVYKTNDYARIRDYAGRGTRLRVVDLTGAHWWVRRGTQADDGGLVLKDALNRSWEREYSGDVDARWFGVQSSTNNLDVTSGLQAAFNVATTKGLNVRLPEGVLHFSDALTLAGSSNGSIFGAGKYRTTLQYIGSSTTIDLLTIARGTINVGGFGVNSHTDMTAGAAVKFSGYGFLDLSDIAAGHPYTSYHKLWNGFVFAGIDFTKLTDFFVRVKNSGITAYGEGAGSHLGHYDLYVSGGKITHCVKGVHIGGGFDNAYFDDTMCTFNGTNVVLDASLSSKPFQNITFGFSFVCEWSQSGPGFHISNPHAAINSSVLVINAHVQDNKTIGISIGAFPGGNIIINSPHISSNKSHGIHIADSSTKLSFGRNVVIKNNAEYGFYSEFNYNVELPSSIYGNTLGGYNDKTKAESKIYTTKYDAIAEVIATGVDQATATIISSGYSRILNSSAAGSGVVLNGSINSEVVIHNAAQKDIKVYPPVGHFIYGVSANLPINLKNGTVVRFTRYANTGWVVSSYVTLSEITAA